MKSRLCLATFVLAGSLAASLLARAQAPQKGARLVVDVGTFRNQKGILGCRLYDSRTGFPLDPPGLSQQRVKLHGAPRAQCVFENLRPGTYAVAVMHDENDNGELDENFLGMPTEGYGVSNNHTHAMKEPSWEESRFSIASAEEMRIQIQLRY